MADLNYFYAPARNSVFATSDCISFIPDDVSNDNDGALKAVLYRADGSWVKDIGEWTGSDITGDDNFQFTWDVDVHEEGEYFVRVFEIENDDDNEDDINRSYTFTISGGGYVESQGQQIQPASFSSEDKHATNVKAASYTEEEPKKAAAKKKSSDKKAKKSNKKKEGKENVKADSSDKTNDKKEVASSKDMRKKRSIYCA
jgi:hypothetical protein